jgi:RNA polymerase primary sigma factor
MVRFMDKVSQKAEKLSSEGPEAPSDKPVLDLSDAAVKALIRTAKRRGYVTHDQINALLASDEVNSEQIENILAKFSEIGINVIDTKEARLGQESAASEEPEEDEEETEGQNEIVKIQHQPVPAKSTVKEPAERSDDPVRMYFGEMRSMELLSREGEIAVAKRIEAGREAMITGLCESPLTFQAIIIWRDELNEGKVLLRDVIDLDAQSLAPEISPDGPLIVPGQVPATAPVIATPFQQADKRTNSDKTEAERAISDSDLDDDSKENWFSAAALLEAELKPKVNRDVRYYCWHLQAAAPTAGPGHPVPA